MELSNAFDLMKNKHSELKLIKDKSQPNTHTAHKRQMSDKQAQNYKSMYGDATSKVQSQAGSQPLFEYVDNPVSKTKKEMLQKKLSEERISMDAKTQVGYKKDLEKRKAVDDYQRVRMDESIEPKFDSKKPVSVKQLRMLRNEMDRPANEAKFRSSKYGIHEQKLPNFYTKNGN